MMPDRDAVERLSILADLGPVRAIEPIRGSANNRVFAISSARGRACLKAYFRHPADTRDRLGAEFAFSRFARSAGVSTVPRELACDPAANLGLFEFVDGVRPREATETLVEEAIAFLRDLNAARWRPAASRLPFAAEACFSIEEHLGLVGGRVNRLADLAPATDLDRTARRFIREELQPMWDEIRNTVRVRGRNAGLDLGRALGPNERCVSPSDFGFHNSLIAPDGRVTFLDFEYAGWDDPAKLICDFFCQPKVPVAEGHFETFARSFAAEFPEPDRVALRARLLLHVYCVKWVCIRLNEFLPAGLWRRQFAAGDQLEERKERQLERACTAFDRLREYERSAA
jgi:hypothetical protein